MAGDSELDEVGIVNGSNPESCSGQGSASSMMLPPPPRNIDSSTRNDKGEAHDFTFARPAPRKQTLPEKASLQCCFGVSQLLDFLYDCVLDKSSTGKGCVCRIRFWHERQ